MTVATTPNPIMFRPGELEEHLVARMTPQDSLGLVAKRDLSRYYAQLDVALGRAVQGALLTRDELRFLTAVAKGKTWDANRPHMLWAEVADADMRLASEYAINLVTLERRLRNLGHFELMALLDAIERYWLLPDSKRRDPDIAMRLVGLLG